MSILQFIPKGRNNAISIEKLAGYAGVSTRKIQREIKKLREEGIPVISLGGCRGYWLTDDIGEIEQYLQECDTRSRSQYFTTVNLRRYVAQAKGEYTVVVREHLRRIPVKSSGESEKSNVAPL